MAGVEEIPARVGAAAVGRHGLEGIAADERQRSLLAEEGELEPPPAFTAARAWQVMHDAVGTNPLSVTELPSRRGRPAPSSKSTCDPFRR